LDCGIGCYIAGSVENKRSFFVGVALLTLSFILCKLLVFALPFAADLGKLGRGIFREGFIGLNLWVGYRCTPSPQFKKQFLQFGLLLEFLFLALVFFYALIPNPPILLMQLQVMFRELLLSPMYFFGFYAIYVNRRSVA
jgi:hypothetical protein